MKTAAENCLLAHPPISGTIREEASGGLLVMNSRGELLQMDRISATPAGNTPKKPPKKPLRKCLGDLLGCRACSASGRTCGKERCCGKCVLWKAAGQALVHNRSYAVQGDFHHTITDKARAGQLRFHAIPFEHEGERLVLLRVDDAGTCQAPALQRSGHKARPSLISGRHPSLQEMLLLLQEAAQTDLSVLLQGESGTGKELAARAIHDLSPRKNKPFVAVNCAALPPNLLESELFGHVKGAFTDAIRDKKGRFELADGGSLFLDEIGEMAPEFQAKLLRVLQEGCFEPVGGTVSKKVDVRLISATNKNLQQEMNAGRFRLDLFYRLCVVPITVPSLRERATDIPLLAEEFLNSFSRDHGLGKKRFSPGVLEILQKYRWPGNIRELINVVQFTMMKCSGATINREHLPQYLTRETGGKVESGHVQKQGRLTKDRVLTALTNNSGNKVRAARELGVARATFYRFIKAGMTGRGATTGIGAP